MIQIPKQIMSIKRINKKLIETLINENKNFNMQINMY